MKKYSFKERFQYWFDNQMSKGTGSMIRMLGIATMAVVVLIAFLIFFMGGDEEVTMGSAFWDSLATVINAWMPYSDDGGVVYVLLTAVVAVVGLLFTSVLIGIVGSGIEDKLTELRKGSSTVLENGHTIVLGFVPGEYTLLNQLVLATEENEKRIILVAESMEKDEMEDLIRDNVEHGSNVRILCRNVDVTDASALECCSIPDAKVVIVNPGQDDRTVKAVLASLALTEREDGSRVPIVAAVSKQSYMLPSHMCEKNNIVMLETGDMIARIIAHSGTQPGLPEAFTEVFNFEGAEFYMESLEDVSGRTFGDVFASAEGGVPVGIYRDGTAMLVPTVQEIVEANDRLIFFAENEAAIRIQKSVPEMDIEVLPDTVEEQVGRVVILGSNETLPIVQRELPENVTRLELSEDKKDLEEIVEDTSHVILLAKHGKNPEKADMDNILTLLRLRDLRERTKQDYTITAEMHREKNRMLVSYEDTTDFIVASDITSMVIAQISENPELTKVFEELLSNDGREFIMKKAASYDLVGKEVQLEALKRQLICAGVLLLGIRVVKEEKVDILLNPTLESICFGEEDSLIVISER